MNAQKFVFGIVAAALLFASAFCAVTAFYVEQVSAVAFLIFCATFFASMGVTGFWIMVTYRE